MNDKKFYTVPFLWNKPLWVMTFLVFALWVGVSGWLLWHVFNLEDNASAVVSLIVFNLTMLPVMLVCEGLAPQRLEIGRKRLVILRRYNSITIYADEVASVEQLPQNALRGALRTGGVGGFFGYYGNYYKSSIGGFKLYATSFDNLFLITLVSGKKIVISGSEPEKMEYFQS